MRPDGVRPVPPRAAGRDDGHLDDRGLLEGDRALLRQPVRAVHLAVVAREDDDGVLPQVEAVELVEDPLELGVHEAQAVDEVAAPYLPQVLAALRDGAVVPFDVALVGVHAVRLAGQVVVEVRRQVDVELRHRAEVLRRVRHRRDAALGVRLLGLAGAQVHDVVWVDHRRDEQPRLVRRPLGAQPVDGLEGDRGVELLALHRAAPVVAPRLVIGEAVVLQRAGPPLHVGEVPLALEGRVVAELPQHRADRGDLRVQAAGPRVVRVVPHADRRGVPAGPHRRARRRTQRDRAVLVVQRHARAHETFQRGQLHPGRQAHVHVPLVHAQQQDVGPSGSRHRGSSHSYAVAVVGFSPA